MNNKHVVGSATNVEFDAVSTHGVGSGKRGDCVFALCPGGPAVGEYLYSLCFSHD